MIKFTKDEVLNAAKGRAVDILRDVAGIPADILDGDHHPCPKCGGKDRFRLIDRDRGAVYCNQCFNRKNGDFLAAVMWFKEITFPETLGQVAEYLGLNPEEGLEAAEWQTVKEYYYTNETGRKAFKTVRQENRSELTEEGKHPKRILQYHAEGDKWLSRLGLDDEGKARSFIPFPYRLELIQSEETRALFICEGEKCADALNELFDHSRRRGEYVASTVSGGSKNMKRWGLFDQYLGDLPVYFLPDNDKAGYTGAREAYAALSGEDAGREFYLMRLDRTAYGEEAPDKFDVADWITEQKNLGEDLEDIAENFFSDLIRAVKVETEAAFDLPDAKPKGDLVILNFAKFLSLEVPPAESIFSPFLMKPSLSEIYAERGIGKTLFALTIAYGIACGGRLFGGVGTDVPLWGAERAARVLYIDGEMQVNEMQKRLNAIAGGYLAGGFDILNREDNFQIFSFGNYAGEMKNCDTTLNLATEEGQAALNPYLDQIDVLVIDNLATLCRAPKTRSNDEESWLPMQEFLLKLRHRGISVIFLHHAGKGGGQRGTSAKEDILDTVIKLERPKDYEPAEGARFILRFEKSRGLCGDGVVSLDCQARTTNIGLFWEAKRLSESKEETVRRLLEENKNLPIEDRLSLRDIADETGVPKSTVARIKKKFDTEAGGGQGD